ncbi:hypothetical protein NEOLEDRAFT_1151714 [Neolentinus lepideus HHB14362 ss-1]|uniref:DUF6533 domain-containing protein n=1 Tax=Neolentinus lepideus HHB14362 ss-1 TaxID=1314782 RepID=A0A165NMJ1_9AGAM|nr:hypothetical protein NEOLEDRAFT_1151714 [Neolentinus lepideus HHB14362 ss-1]
MPAFVASASNCIKEVKYIWGSRFRLSAILYIFCRYTLLANVLYLLAVAGKLHQRWAPNVATSRYRLDRHFQLQYMVQAVLTLRAYAVYSRNRIVLAYLGTLGAGCVALDITHVPGLRCVGSSTNELLSILMVVFEFSSAILTTTRSVQALKGNGLSWKEQKTGFFYLILEQGFAFIETNERCTKGRSAMLSGLLTARFVLHLRRWERNSDAVVSGGKSTPGNERNQELSEFEAVRRTMTSLVDEFGEDPVVRERHRDTLPVERDPVASQSIERQGRRSWREVHVGEGREEAGHGIGRMLNQHSE